VANKKSKAIAIEKLRVDDLSIKTSRPGMGVRPMLYGRFVPMLNRWTAL
jgi:hypothetical protein